MKCKCCSSEKVAKVEYPNPFGGLRVYDRDAFDYRPLRIYGLEVCMSCGHIDFYNNFSPKPVRKEYKEGEVIELNWV